ncbi:MAG: hypothetical protein V3V29_10160 [Acidimicrobiia bacterium]
MRIDLHRQLRDYGAALEEAQAAITGAEVAERVDVAVRQMPTGRRRIPVWKHPALVASAAAVMALVLGGLVLGIARWISGGDSTLVDEPPVTTVVATTLVPQPRVDMERVLEGSSFEHNWMTSVVVGGPGLVAGGAAFDGYYHDAAVWTSPDGRTWERVGDDPAVFGDEASTNEFGGVLPDANQLITDLVSGPLGLVAVGAEGKPGDLDAAVWVSPDGLTWERVPHDEEVFGGEGDQTMRSVVQTSDGVVAVGASGGHAAVWVSSDGRAWIRARINSAASSSELNDIAFAGGGLVAVGGVGLDWDNSGLGGWTPRPTAEPAMWFSTDGTVWNRVPDPTAEGQSGEPSAGSLTVIAAGRRGVVVIGAGPVGPVVWTSQDGSEWHALDAEFLDESTTFHAVVDDLAWDGDRLVAVGGFRGTTPGFGWAPIRVAIWVSVDGGTTWQLGSEADLALGEAGISDTPVPSPARLAQFGTSIVVVGNDAIPTDQDINGYIQHARNAAVWIVKLASVGQ